MVMLWYMAKVPTKLIVSYTVITESESIWQTKLLNFNRIHFFRRIFEMRFPLLISLAYHRLFLGE